VPRARREKAKKKKLLGSHQRCWVWGRHVVVEILRGGRWPVVELFLDQELPADELDDARRLAEKQATPVRLEPASRVFQLCHSKEHQGYLAKMSPFPYTDAGEILSRDLPSALFVILDSVQDAHNFGAIVRSAEALGVDAVFIGEKGQVGVTSMVVRSSSGAACRVPIAQVPDLQNLVEQITSRGIQVVAASEKAENDCASHDFRSPAAIILGNESAGITEDLMALSDAAIRVPHEGEVGSLNVAAAAAVIFYEVQRQRGKGDGED
jgi:23S rRNA (guanosine2251-2'-O)-methyltransferase